MKDVKKNEFEQMGGRQALIEISKVFYDKIYQHAWLKNYFKAVSQQHIESQQVDFMQSALGGGKVYVGKAPPVAHQHMYITEELYAARQLLLNESFKACGASQLLIDKWLKVDDAFFARIVKSNLSECQKRYATDEILDFVDPRN